MPRKQEIKATQVLEYFTAAPLEAAKLVLELSTKAVKLREPKKPADRPARNTAHAGSASGAGASPVSETTAAAPSTEAAAPRRRAARSSTAPAPPMGSAPATESAAPGTPVGGLAPV